MFLHILFGTIFIIIGLFCFFKPDLVWEITEEWKTYSGGDPSDLYITKTKLSGIVLIITGTIIIILSFIAY